MRRDRLPPTFPANKDIREANRDVVRNVGVFAPTMGASSDDRGVAKYSDTHIIDLKGHDPMDSGLENVPQHVTKGRDSTIRSSYRPIWSDDVLDSRPISRDPRLGEALLNLRKLLARLGHTLLDVGSGEQEQRRRQACHHNRRPRVRGNRKGIQQSCPLRRRVAVVGV